MKRDEKQRRKEKRRSDDGDEDERLENKVSQSVSQSVSEPASQPAHYACPAEPASLRAADTQEWKRFFFSSTAPARGEIRDLDDRTLLGNSILEKETTTTLARPRRPSSLLGCFSTGLSG